MRYEHIITTTIKGTPVIGGSFTIHRVLGPDRDGSCDGWDEYWIGLSRKASRIPVPGEIATVIEEDGLMVAIPAIGKWVAPMTVRKPNARPTDRLVGLDVVAKLAEAGTAAEDPYELLRSIEENIRSSETTGPRHALERLSDLRMAVLFVERLDRALREKIA